MSDDFEALAGDIVRDCLARLPRAVRREAAHVPVVIEDRPDDALVDDGVDPDVLGLFIGNPHSAPDEPGPPPCIMLYVDNILLESEEAGTTFEEEVRKTYLHELGHYLGFDEDDIAARGLD